MRFTRILFACVALLLTTSACAKGHKSDCSFFNNCRCQSWYNNCSVH